jgi:hypothetical protein
MDLAAMASKVKLYVKSSRSNRHHVER